MAPQASQRDVDPVRAGRRWEGPASSGPQPSAREGRQRQAGRRSTRAGGRAQAQEGSAAARPRRWKSCTGPFRGLEPPSPFGGRGPAAEDDRSGTLVGGPLRGSQARVSSRADGRADIVGALDSTAIRRGPTAAAARRRCGPATGRRFRRARRGPSFGRTAGLRRASMNPPVDRGFTCLRDRIRACGSGRRSGRRHARGGPRRSTRAPRSPWPRRLRHQRLRAGVPDLRRSQRQRPLVARGGPHRGRAGPRARSVAWVCWVTSRGRGGARRAACNRSIAALEVGPGPGRAGPAPTPARAPRGWRRGPPRAGGCRGSPPRARGRRGNARRGPGRAARLVVEQRREVAEGARALVPWRSKTSRASAQRPPRTPRAPATRVAAIMIVIHAEVGQHRRVQPRGRRAPPGRRGRARGSRRAAAPLAPRAGGGAPRGARQARRTRKAPAARRSGVGGSPPSGAAQALEVRREPGPLDRRESASTSTEPARAAPGSPARRGPCGKRRPDRVVVDLQQVCRASSGQVAQARPARRGHRRPRPRSRRRTGRTFAWRGPVPAVRLGDLGEPLAGILADHLEQVKRDVGPRGPRRAWLPQHRLVAQAAWSNRE